jgi:gliding motility-associated-like protein
MKLTQKKIIKSLLFAFTVVSFTGKAQCPNPAVLSLIAEDTNTVFHVGQGTTNTITSPYSCSSMAFCIYPTSSNTTSAGIAQPCIRTRYNMYYTNVRQNVTESRYEGGNLIFTLAPGNPAANRIGGATPPASGASLWDFSLYQLDPTMTHSVSIVKTGGGAITSDSISVRDCWRNTPASTIYASNPAFTTGVGIAWSDPANSGHLGTTAWSISPAAAWPAVFDFGSGIYYVDPLYLSPATYTVTYTFTPPVVGASPCPAINLTYTFTVAPPSAATYNPAWTAINFCSAQACTGLSGQVTGTTGGDWSGTGVSGTSFCPSVSGVGSFPVTYTIGPSATCGNSQTHTLTVTATPTLGLAATTYSMCTGGNVVLNASGATTYTWAPAGSLSSANSPTPTASPASTQVYTVTGTSATGNCASSSKTVTVTVNTPPTITVGAANYTMCPGSSVGISASGASTYTWAPAGSLSNPNISNPTANPGSTQIYTVTGTSAAGCVSASSATTAVTVNTPPTITLGASNYTMCPGGSVGISASGASTYTWSPAVSLSNPNISNPTANPGSTQVYTVNGTDASGCTSTTPGTATVTVNTPSTLSLGSPTYTICPGGTVGMSVSGASTYTWTPAGSLDNANSATPNSTPVSNTVYTVTGTDASGCAAAVAATATVTINTPPTITVGAANYTICPGGNVGISASGASTYTWSPAGSLSNTNVSNPTANPGSTQVYTVTGTDASGCTAGSAATTTVTVNTPITPTITAVPSSLCTGGTTTLTATGASTYTWSANAASATTSTVSITPAGTDTYTVNGTDLSGCATNPGTITVNVSAALTVTITASSVSICSGQTTTLTASGATTYTWMPGPFNTTSISVNPSINTTYTLTGSNGGCTGTTVATVTVAATPTVSPSASSASICSGQTTTLTASGATNYTWMPGNINTNTVSVSPGSTQIYTVTGESGGCSSNATVNITVTATPTVTATAASSGTVCAGQTINLTGSGATSYTWMPGSIFTAVASVSPATNTTYTLTGANGTCTSTQTVAVSVTSLPSLTVTASTASICSGDPAVIITSSGATTYTWSANAGSVNTNTVSVTPSTTTTYTVAGTTAGCDNTGTVMVTVTPTPTLTIASSPTVICSGQSSTLTGSGATSYTWMPGSIFTAVTSVSPATGTTYTLTGANGTCAATQTVAVAVNQSPTISNTATADSARCGVPTGSVSAVTASGGTTPYTYQWYNGSAPIAGATNDSLTGAGAGTYSVLITDANGCVATGGTTSFNIGGSPAVIASISPHTATGQAPLNVSFTNNTTGASQYSWTFGNGLTVSTLNAGTTYNTPGTYTVVMIASNSNNTCFGKDTAVIIVDVATTIIIPNIFSPNGDGLNDNFMIATTGMKTLNCEIYNRWGTKICTLTAPNQVWDGKTPSGEAASEGTYYCILSAQGYDGKPYTYEGPLTLVK